MNKNNNTVEITEEQLVDFTDAMRKSCDEIEKGLIETFRIIQSHNDYMEGYNQCYIDQQNARNQIAAAAKK